MIQFFLKISIFSSPQPNLHRHTFVIVFEIEFEVHLSKKIISTMKKIFQLFAFCLFAITLWGKENSPPVAALDSLCNVSLSWDSTATGEVVISAFPFGEAPYSFIWSTGESTQTIPLDGWGTNYCVTVTDATGCVATGCLFNQNACNSYIYTSPNAGLTAVGSGVSPFTYLWNNGSTDESIIPNAAGVYCVTMTDVLGCSASACATWGLTQDTCDVAIVFDTLSSGAGFTAIPSGTAPFSYQWWPGGNTQYIPLNPAYFGDYCVTVTDASGCIAIECAFGSNNGCSIWILESDTIGITGLYAIASMPSNPVTYLWSTGETSSVIFPNNPGTYCVTATGGGCTANVCYNYQIVNNYNISGYLYFPDSINNPGPMEGTVELFFLEANSNNWESLGTVAIESNSAGWSNHYDFGTQATPGQYLVKATLDPSSPNAGDYLPTYHFSTVHWGEADLITLPSAGFGLFNIILSDGTNLTGGSGNISGTVTEGDGFADNDGNNRSGTPRPNTSVLLFDNNEQPVSHVLTDELGRYGFSNLPFGTYKLEVEIVGTEQAERWVTLSPANPNSAGNDFEVTETGIVLALKDLLAGNGLELAPNPTAGNLNIWLEATDNFQAKINIARLDGTTVLTENQQVVKGKQAIQLDLSSLPTGLYLLQVTTGRGVVAAKVVKN